MENTTGSAADRQRRYELRAGTASFKREAERVRQQMLTEMFLDLSQLQRDRDKLWLQCLTQEREEERQLRLGKDGHVVEKSTYMTFAECNRKIGMIFMHLHALQQEDWVGAMKAIFEPTDAGDGDEDEGDESGEE